MSKLVSILNEDEMVEFAAVVYQVWRRRNSLIFEERFWDPRKVVKLAMNEVTNYKEAN